MNQENIDNNQPCYFFEFGLFVTGETEEQHLPDLFRSFMETGICTFKVIRRIGQLNPITSQKKNLKMVGTGKIIPDKDAEKIGFPAREYLAENPCRYVLVVDDLENDRVSQAELIFQRYHNALDTILKDKKHRAAFHFLVNMIETYYFADAQAINTVLGTSLEDHPEDVEKIPHPKNILKKLYPGFNEKQDGGKIVKLLRFEHILSRPDTCASLRTLFYWCYKVLQKHPQPDILEYILELFPVEQYHFHDGILSDITKQQLEDIE
ncbi:DUF4276 family protein [Sphaerospermopsis sp. LEGE 08334]|uniref:DUF4276 family protein n=1 Tax=Sphaerospermopsis sp. LEGE 08334 TaxID=1828651 RepID=UPI00187EBB31|nr:DUF4276 family protein [Sphaerospermopsis sp. LEGE 08334]MBE9055099.1 DUF4276 family protein [Sphaerospermopsis sp. LEGE 08334]